MDANDDAEAVRRKIWEERHAKKRREREGLKEREPRYIEVERWEREAEERREKRRRDKERDEKKKLDEEGDEGHQTHAESRHRDGRSLEKSPTKGSSRDGRRSASPARRREGSPPSSRRSRSPRGRSISTSSSLTEFGPPRPPPPPSPSSSRLPSTQPQGTQASLKSTSGSRKLADSLGIDGEVGKTTRQATNKSLEGLLALFLEHNKIARATVSNSSTSQTTSSHASTASTSSSEARIESGFRKEGLDALKPRLANLVASLLQGLTSSDSLFPPLSTSTPLDARLAATRGDDNTKHLSWTERMDAMEERMRRIENEEEENLRERENVMDGVEKAGMGADDAVVVLVKKFEAILRAIGGKVELLETTWKEKPSIARNSNSNPPPNSLSPQITFLVKSLLATHDPSPLSSAVPPLYPPSSFSSFPPPTPRPLTTESSTQALGNASPALTLDGQPLSSDDAIRLLAETLRSVVGTSSEKMAKLEENAGKIEAYWGS